jgi:hypothetical protein
VTPASSYENNNSEYSRAGSPPRSMGPPPRGSQAADHNPGRPRFRGQARAYRGQRTPHPVPGRRRAARHLRLSPHPLPTLATKLRAYGRRWTSRNRPAGMSG